VDQVVNAGRKTLFLRLSAIVFFAELAHGMLLYGIIPELVQKLLNGQEFTVLGRWPVEPVELAGICLAAYVLAELAFKLPAGHVVDHRGPDLPLRLGLILSLATIPVILLTGNPYVMLLGAFLHGLGAAPIWPAVISSWTRGRSAKERGEIMGQILTVWMAGLGIGLILGNVLVELTGKQELAASYAPFAMWIVALGAAIWGGQLGTPVCGTGEEGVQSLRLQFPPELRVMAVGLFLQNLAFGSLILTFREATREHLMLTPSQFGYLVALGGGPAVLLMGPMGKVADRIGRRNAVIYSMLVVAPLIIAAPFLSYLEVDPLVRFALMVPGLVIAAAAYALLLPAWHALALGRIPEQQRGRSLALLMSIEMVALGGGHLVGPTIYEKISFLAPFLFAGVTFGVLAVVYRLGFILPQEVPEEPHAVDLGPLSPNGGGHVSRLDDLRPPPPAPAPRSGE
jgi:MFS family permease